MVARLQQRHNDTECSGHSRGGGNTLLALFHGCQPLFKTAHGGVGVAGIDVHPREVVKLALTKNAAAVIVAHNHPSGNAEPSKSDIAITRRLKEALNLMEIRLLDHFVVGRGDVISLADRGHLQA